MNNVTGQTNHSQKILAVNSFGIQSDDECSIRITLVGYDLVFFGVKKHTCFLTFSTQLSFSIPT
jgi:hypothetical protein